MSIILTRPASFSSATTDPGTPTGSDSVFSKSPTLVEPGHTVLLDSVLPATGVTAVKWMIQIGFGAGRTIALEMFCTIDNGQPSYCLTSTIGAVASLNFDIYISWDTTNGLEMFLNNNGAADIYVKVTRINVGKL